MTDRHREIYRDEAYEILAELESSLLTLEKAPGDAETVDRVFRAMHTIKGSGAMFGFDDIASFTHEVETVFDMVRRGELAVTGELIDLTLKARDRIKAMLDGDAETDSDRADAAAIIASLRALCPAGAKPADPAPEAPATGKDGRRETEDDAARTYRIRFRAPKDIFLRGANPVTLLNELRAIGVCTVAAETDAIPLLDDLDPEQCYAYWDVLLNTRRRTDAIRDVFIFVEDDSELSIDVIDYGEAGAEEYKNLGDILLERGDISVEGLRKVLARQKRLGEMLVEAGLVSENKVRTALLEQQHIKERREKRQAAETTGSIRVASEKLDLLVNLVGELVTVQARFGQMAERKNDAEMVAFAEEVERLTWELRDNAMSIRMLPIGTTFSRFRRLVRDLSAELGKDIELTTEGAETEIDKTVIDKLFDPLVHLIRNSIDHGIETPDAREARGKPRRGTIHLSATHAGANVLIRVRDDGAGLDRDAIHARAVAAGLIAPGAELGDKELSALILLPGFSTAEAVTSVSGRGVGMDVVRRGIEALRGSLEIDSRPGEGTTVIVRLPLTLAIIDGLLMSVGDGFFVLPLHSVEECIELSRTDAAMSRGRDIAEVRGHAVPYIRLRERFAIAGEPPGIEQIVIADVEGSRVGFVVDHVVGGLQTVIKSLGRVYRDVDGVSGSTILGDGTVALILDAPRILRGAEREERASLQ